MYSEEGQFSQINVCENQCDNQEWRIQGQSLQHWAQDRNEDKQNQKKNPIY